MEDLLQRVRQHLDPAYVFVMSYLQLLAETADLGALAVWLGDQGLRGRSLGTASLPEIWGEEIGKLMMESEIGPKRISRFCTQFRANPQGDDRCLQCDLRWIARARKSRRSWVYECHAGLTEIVAPIIVRGKSVGQVMGGQLVCPERQSGGFPGVWRRIRDVPGLDKEGLSRAYMDLRVIHPPELRQLKGVIETVARTFGALLENVSDLVVREKQVGRTRAYEERDFVELILGGGPLSEEEALGQVQVLGISQVPSVAIVVRMDLTDQAAFDLDSPARHGQFLRMLEAVHEIVRSVPNTVTASIRPNELVILTRPPEGRNPELQWLRLKELAARIQPAAARVVSVPVRIGIGGQADSVMGLRQSYREAQLAAGHGADAVADVLRRNPTAWVRELSREFLAVLREMKEAVRAARVQPLQSLIERQFRIAAAVPEEDRATRRLFFTHLLIAFLEALKDAGCDADAVDSVLSDYIAAYPALRSLDDLLEWFHAHWGAIEAEMHRQRRSPREQIVARAAALIAERLHEPPDRVEVAQALGMSPTYFGKVFRRQTGVTFRDYVLRVRIAAAQKLLLDAKKTAAQVATEVGYASSGALSRAFEEVCGVSPSTYRNDPRRYEPVRVPGITRARAAES